MSNGAMAITVCGHSFCTSCLVNFVFKQKSNLCPICDCCMVVATDQSVAKAVKKVTISPPVVRMIIAPTLPVQLNTVKKTAVKKARPVPRVPDESATEYEKKVYEKKIIMSNFNDGKISFITPDGTDFLLRDYHKLVAQFKVNQCAMIQGDELFFENSVTGIPDRVFIPKFKEIKPRALSQSVELEKEGSIAQSLVEREDPTHVEIVD